VRESVGDRVALEARDPIVAKGIEIPVQAYRILQAEQASEASTDLATIVGREEEVERMRDALARAVEGSGQIVTIVGEAGIGKTRLVEELIDEARRSDVIDLVGRCQPHSTGRPYAPWSEILESLLEVDGQSGDNRLDQIESVLEEIEPGYSRWAPVFSDALCFTIPDSDITLSLAPEERQPRVYRVVTDLFRAQRNPIAVVFEDAHWMDLESQGLLLYLASQVENLPLLIVVLSRPGLDLRDYRSYDYHTHLVLCPINICTIV
jgi:adenylate cyclase